MSSDQTELRPSSASCPQPRLQSLRALEAGPLPRPCALAPCLRRAGRRGMSAGVDMRVEWVPPGPPIPRAGVGAVGLPPRL